MDAEGTILTSSGYGLRLRISLLLTFAISETFQNDRFIVDSVIIVTLAVTIVVFIVVMVIVIIIIFIITFIVVITILTIIISTVFVRL